MSEKILNTRIQLRYDSFTNWQKGNNDGTKDRGALLKKGELAVAYLADAKTTTTPDNGTHPIMFKVGPGYFNELPWASALAADVYAWAKGPNKPTYDADEIKVDATDNHFNGKGLDAALTEIWNEIVALTGGEEGAGAIADQIKAGIVAIKGDTATAGSYVTGVSIDEDGNLKVSEAALPASATPEQGNKADSAIQTLNILGKALNKDTNTLSADEAKAALGLGSAAYKDVNDFDEDGAAAQALADAKSYVEGLEISIQKKDGKENIVIADNEGKEIASVDASKFVADGMLTDVTYDANKNELSLTWNTDAGITKTPISLEDLVDVYTGGTGITVSSNGEISVTDYVAKSEDLTKVINGTTVVAKASHAINADNATNAVNATNATNAENAADSNKLNGQTADFYLAKNEAAGYADILTKTEAGTTYQPKGNYATSEQGAKADAALQTVSAGTGLKVAEKANNNQEIGFDPDCVFVFDCGDASGNPLN